MSAPAVGARWTAGGRLVLLAWLSLIWVLLWGTWSWANVLSGLAVAVVVTGLLPLPALAGGVRVHPVALLELLGRLAVDLVSASAEVAWLTVSPQGSRRSAIVSVQLRVDSDLLITLVAITLSLVPGSLVLDVDRERRTLVLHLLHVRDVADVDRQKAEVLAVESRVVRAFGLPADVEAVTARQGEFAGEGTR